MIDEDLDQDLEMRARAEGTSKAAIIREIVRADFDRRGWKPVGPDSPIWNLIGSIPDLEPIEDEDDIDRIVYGI